MSFLTVSDLTGALLQLKSAVAVKIAHLLVKNPGETFAATYPLLRKLLNCGSKALQSALDELAQCGWVELSFKDTILTMKISAAASVHHTHKDVFQSHNVNAQSSSPVFPSEKAAEIDSPAQNPALKLQNSVPKFKKTRLPADLEEEEEEDKFSSSSSSLKSGRKSNILTEKRKNDAVPAGNSAAPPELKTLVRETLSELGMNREFVFRRVYDAAAALPLDDAADTLRNCLLHNPQTPAYLIEALQRKQQELSERRESEFMRQNALQCEIAWGEMLLAGKELNFECLGQSQGLRRFAQPMFDPIAKKCRLKAEYREELEAELVKMRLRSQAFTAD